MKLLFPTVTISLLLVTIIPNSVVSAYGEEQKHVRNVGFTKAPTEPGAIQHIRHANGTIVDPYAIQIGLPPKLSQTVLEYCQKMGIVDVYKEIFFNQQRAKELKPGTNRIFTVNNNDNEQEWYLQRPEAKWRSNMHWLNCNNEAAHDRYLALLGQGGFDTVLEAIGTYFNLDGIDVYSAGFIGVTHCEQGFMHTDFEGADGKAFNVLIPLELVDGSDPEFLITEPVHDNKIGVHYEYDVALAVGDYTAHATAECDYRHPDTAGKMRMALSIYLADINEDNVESIIRHYTDPFPPQDPAYLLNHRGRHWKKDGSAKLPTTWPGQDPEKEEETMSLLDQLAKLEAEITEDEEGNRIVTKPSLKASPKNPGDIQTIQWEDGTVVDPYAFQIGLPDGLAKTVLDYCEEAGILDLYRELFGSIEGQIVRPDAERRDLQDGANRIILLDGGTWFLQRPEMEWRSNMYWMSSNDERSHERYLSVLRQGGFDVVLDALGKHLGLNGLDVYSVGFIAETQCEEAFMHTDFERTEGKAFNILIPLDWVETDYPDLLVKQKEDRQTIGVHYEPNVGFAVGDLAVYATSDCDYRFTHPGRVRLTMTIYVADIDEGNVYAIIDDMTDPFPPTDDPQYFLNHRGRHWKKDGSTHLPEECVIPPLEHTPEEAAEFLEKAKAQEKKKPTHWTEFDRTDFWYAFDCPEVFQTPRPVPTGATWNYMRETYRAIVGEDASSISTNFTSGVGGFRAPVEARLTKNRGRGIFATDDIAKHSLVWRTDYTARFPSSLTYRQYLLTLSPDLACEAMPWSYVQRMPTDNETDVLHISMDLDIGALINSGSLFRSDGTFPDTGLPAGQIPPEWDEYANVGCIENDMEGGCENNYFALRDIYVGEELFVHYANFSNANAWFGFGLECTVCDVHSPDD